ncbi:hypothetical protein ABG79_00703 [Caloramator mitchellensis]|uniref:Uncharacterized protein n=1 Tax=Caloramator mitchellensis TaxID=908809 RepID=A0A0R3K2Y4_CALMK|nr:hypothetical protein ABG79_00703 [Caloramator mitchellensis]
MAKVLATIIAYISFFLFDFFVLFHKKDIKKFFVYSTLFLTAFVLSILISLGIRIISLDLFIKKLFFD